MNLKQAVPDDFETVKNTYLDIIENTPGQAEHAKWVWGQHPDDELVKDYIAKGELYFYMSGDKIAGIVVISLGEPEEYKTVDWGIKLAAGEATVLHLLALTPEFQGKGLSKEFLKACIDFSRDKGKKAVRLDTLVTNLPAQHMYKVNGFNYRGKQNLYACNTGMIDFLYYEYIL